QRAYRPYGPRPAQLMAQELAGAPFRAGVGDYERGYRHLHAGGAHRFTHRIVVGEIAEEGFEATNRRERLAAERDRRTKTWPREAKPYPDEDVGKEMVVDRHARKACPRPGSGCTAVEAGDEADIGPIECRDGSRQIVLRDGDVAVGNNHDVVANAPLHFDEIGD